MTLLAFAVVVFVTSGNQIITKDNSNLHYVMIIQMPSLKHAHTKAHTDIHRETHTGAPSPLQDGLTKLKE